MAIHVKCPNPACGKEFNLKTEMAGKTVKCAACGQAFQVPAAPGLTAETQRAQRPEQKDSGLGPSTSSGQRVQGSGKAATAGTATPGPAKPETRNLKLDPLVGQRLAEYEIQARLGQGAMGMVYKARNVNLDRVVALKILPDTLVQQGKNYVERFLQEARAAAKLNHPNVVGVYRIGEAAGKLFIEMEYMDGGSLVSHLASLSALTAITYVGSAGGLSAGLKAFGHSGFQTPPFPLPPPASPATT